MSGIKTVVDPYQATIDQLQNAAKSGEDVNLFISYRGLMHCLKAGNLKKNFDYATVDLGLTRTYECLEGIMECEMLIDLDKPRSMLVTMVKDPPSQITLPGPLGIVQEFFRILILVFYNVFEHFL